MAHSMFNKNTLLLKKKSILKQKNKTKQNKKHLTMSAVCEEILSAIYNKFSEKGEMIIGLGIVLQMF